MKNYIEPKVYAVKHKCEEVRMDSRSGGIFTALSDEILQQKGVVYGCVLNDKFEAVHIRAENENIRDRMRGSKYIQSKLGDTYKNVKIDIENGRKVLFSGTSCQVAGLKRYLENDYKNLLCVDIVCHGVPSPKVWEKYMRWQEENNSAQIVAVDFRNKKEFGWREHVETLTMNDGNKINSKVFAKLFQGRNILRPSCYECPYKKVMHPGDITIADYWGIERAAFEFDDNKGVSLVLVNSERGDGAFSSVKDEVKWKSTKLEDSLQPSLIGPFAAPKERDKFWEDFYSLNFKVIAYKYGELGVINKVKRRLREIKRKLVK